MQADAGIRIIPEARCPFVWTRTATLQSYEQKRHGNAEAIPPACGGHFPGWAQNLSRLSSQGACIQEAPRIGVSLRTSLAGWRKRSVGRASVC